LSKVIIALDFNDPAKALDFARKIRYEIRWVKVGLELFIRSGPEILAGLKELGFRVFLDLKLLDIPNTVSGAVSSCVDNGADMLTVHILGGEKMIKAAINARDRAAGQVDKTLLLGVTLLTSMEQKDLPWPEQRNTGQIVYDLARMAHGWGLDGCVCSGLEAETIRKMTAGDFYLVTPGIRTSPGQDDQKRIVTPEQAQRAGADFLVIGRPVTQSPDPVQTLRDIKSRLT
jgi:orotidine-5'-phosphate decarboxylase